MMKKTPLSDRKISTERILFFLKTGIWRVRKAEVGVPVWIGIRALRIIILTLQGFVENRGQMRASALTFYSLLSIVPVLAMIFGVAKGFGFQKTLEAEMSKAFSAHGEIASRVIVFANRLLENTKGGLVAGVGFAFLIWAVLKVLSNIEKSFNEIWGVQEPRSWARKISDYLSLMLLLPLFFVSSSAATVLAAGSMQAVAERVRFLGYFGPLVQLALSILPLAAIWFMFTFLYIFMPNTRVRFRPALLAGVVAGTAYQLFQIVYVTLQVGVARHNAIYGSFAALPLFLIWLEASWMIVLSGAELSFATQNVDTYEFEPDANLASPAFRKLLSLRIVNLLVERFSPGQNPMDEEAVSRELGIPVRLLRKLLHDLVEAGVISPVRPEKDKMLAYQPAFDPREITIAAVLERLEREGTEDLPVVRSPELDQLRECLEKMAQENRASKANRLLEEIGKG